VGTGRSGVPAGDDGWPHLKPGDEQLDDEPPGDEPLGDPDSEATTRPIRASADHASKDHLSGVAELKGDPAHPGVPPVVGGVGAFRAR
jgi:hypothetical protein